jgi:hypothetical protein
MILNDDVLIDVLVDAFAGLGDVKNGGALTGPVCVVNL